MTGNQPLSWRADQLKSWKLRIRGIAYVIVLAVAALLPAMPAHGSNAPSPRVMVQHAATALPLPAIPYLQTTPWLSWEPYRNGLKVDTLLLPVSPLKDALDERWHRNPLDLPTS